MDEAHASIATYAFADAPSAAISAATRPPLPPRSQQRQYGLVCPMPIVLEVLYEDAASRKAKKVRVMDSHTHQIAEYFSKMIFLNASTIATAAILLNSVSASFPDGLGNSSGQVGHNLMDHFTGTGIQGEHNGFADQYYAGRRPTGIYIPRFRNIAGSPARKDYIRGFGFQGMGGRLEWPDRGGSLNSFGGDFKQQLLQPGPWYLWMGAWGETLPYYDNRVTLSGDQKDQWGLPLVKLHFEYHENEAAMRKDIQAAAREMLQNAGFTNIYGYNHQDPGGTAVHEMGTARMGRDPRTSVLNAFNQMHDVKNVFITDGSCMTSSACQNPSLTYMALTARACDYAVAELNKGNL